MFDFPTLKVIWWLLLGILLIGFAIMDGFDLGAGMLLPFIGRSDTERRVVINTIGPVWEGNQVWLILGGGAIFAAWPALYAASFSGFYLAMMLVLAALILRPVGFKFRSKMPGARWRANWDWALFVGGLVPSLVFGVAMGNLLEGVPFSFDSELRATYTFRSFRPVESVRIALRARQRGDVGDSRRGRILRSRRTASSRSVPARSRASRPLHGYAVSGRRSLVVARSLWFRHHGRRGARRQSDPLAKTAIAQSGAWFANYARWPATRSRPPSVCSRRLWSPSWPARASG